MGTPQREFLHVDDLGEACVFALEHWQPEPMTSHLNVSTVVTQQGIGLAGRERRNADSRGRGGGAVACWRRPRKALLGRPAWVPAPQLKWPAFSQRLAKLA